MSKDPAFLFYSKDFYEGTRTMLPEERACYIDLLIYQHQNGGYIPDDIKRVQMYCSGCSEQVIKNVLNQKFEYLVNQTVNQMVDQKSNQMVNGWFNKRLTKEMKIRGEGKPKKIAASCLAGLISRSKLTKEQKNSIKSQFNINDLITDNGLIIKNEELIKSKVREWFNHLVNQMVNNLAIANAIANESVNKDKNINEGKGVVGEKPKNQNQAEKNFEEARKIYPGTKRGFETEWKYFKKVHHDYAIVAYSLVQAIENQKSHRNKLRFQGKFVPEWKHFKTWLYNRGWEEHESPPAEISKTTKLNAVNPNRAI